MKFSSNYYRGIKLINTRYFISSYFLRGSLKIIIFSAALNYRNDGSGNKNIKDTFLIKRYFATYVALATFVYAYVYIYI